MIIAVGCNELYNIVVIIGSDGGCNEHNIVVIIGSDGV